MLPKTSFLASDSGVLDRQVSSRPTPLSYRRRSRSPPPPAPSSFPHHSTSYACAVPCLVLRHTLSYAFATPCPIQWPVSSNAFTMTFPALISWVMPSCRHRSAPSSLEAVHSRACPISHPLPVSHPPALKSRPPSMKCTDPRTASSFNLPSPSSPPNSFLIHVFGLTCSTVPLEQVLRFSKPLAKIEGETTINRGGVRGEVECTGNQLQQAPAVSPRLLPSSRMHFQPFVFAWVWCNACSCSCSCPALVNDWHWIRCCCLAGGWRSVPV